MEFKPIIDNQKGNKLADAIKYYASNSKEIKIATGYFFLSGFNIVQDDLINLREPKEKDAPFKLIMGDETREFTAISIKKGYDLKEKLAKQIKEDIGSITLNAGKKLYSFAQMIEKGYLDIKVFNKQKFHAKGYLFLTDLSGKYPKGNLIVGSSNFSHSGGSENLELNLNDRNGFGVTHFDEWFDNIWDQSEDFSLELIKIIKSDPRYKEYENTISEYQYLEPIDFFKRFIADNNKLYLLQDFEKEFDENVEVDLLNFQQLTFEHALRKMFKLGGFIISNAVGLGKTFTATKVMWYFKRTGILKGKKILLCIPPRIRKDWEDALSLFGLKQFVKIQSMGALHKSPYDDKTVPKSKRFNLDVHKDKYSLIVADEAHHYRNESNRTHNLKGIMRENNFPFLLQLTATPINKNHKDLLSLLELFIFERNITKLEKEGLKELFIDFKNLVKAKKNFETLTKEDLQLIKEVERKFSIKLTWQNIFDIDMFRKDLSKFVPEEKIKAFKQPKTSAEEYKYSKAHFNIFLKCVGKGSEKGLLEQLSYEHAKLWEDEYKEDKNLTQWYRWQLYKRLESCIFAFYDSLKRLAIRLQFFYVHLSQEFRDKDVRIGSSYKKYVTRKRFLAMKNTFFNLDKNKQEKVRKNLKNDLELVLQNIIFIINNIKNENLDYGVLNLALDKKYEELFGTVDFKNKDFPFEEDNKFLKLKEILLESITKKQKIVVFSESKATVDYLHKSLNNAFKLTPFANKIALAHGDLENSQIKKIIDLFEIHNKIDLIITTDVLSEGINLPSADVVINFDLPFSPTKLMQRAGRALRINNPKQIFIHNFKPDVDVETEIELYSRLDMRISNILEIVGLDFLMWEFESNEKFDLKTKELKDIALDVQKYQDKMAKGELISHDDYGDEIFDQIDLAIKRIIVKYHLGLKDIKSEKWTDKPYYTVSNSKENGFCITLINEKEEKVTENINLIPKLTIENLKNENIQIKDSDKVVMDQIKDDKYRSIIRSQTMDEDVKKGSSYKGLCLRLLSDFLKEELSEINEKTVKGVLGSIKRNQISNKRLKSLSELIKPVSEALFIDDTLTSNNERLKSYIEKGVNETLTKKEDLKIFSFIKGVKEGVSKV